MYGRANAAFLLSGEGWRMQGNRCSRKARRGLARRTLVALFGASALSLLVIGVTLISLASPAPDQRTTYARGTFEPRQEIDDSGYSQLQLKIEPWNESASLALVAKRWREAAPRALRLLDRDLKAASDPEARVRVLLKVASIHQGIGEIERAGELLKQARAEAEPDPQTARKLLYTLIFEQGVNALRLGENENCVQCLGESACIVPISRSAVHEQKRGSTAAAAYFREYLKQFPASVEARWLLSIATMTLGKYPEGMSSRERLNLDAYLKRSDSVPHFQNMAVPAGLSERLNISGGAIMDDFDNDGRLDLFITSYAHDEPMEFYWNKGDGAFEARGSRADLSGITGGGLNCRQTDYNNDGFLDVFVVRGAWQLYPARPSLLRNNGNGTFTDVTVAAGLGAPLNSISAAWSDYDNDGDLDVFVCCEQQPNRLYRNEGNGKFKNVLDQAGLSETPFRHCKGAAWLDYNDDRRQDLFVSYFEGTARFYRNKGNGKFEDVTIEVGIDGPEKGFSCWAWDFDNDGRQDLFANCYEQTLADIVRGMTGERRPQPHNRLFRNVNGREFKDVAYPMGVNDAFAAMASNLFDMDNDGYLDFYLGTGNPFFSTLVPNRAFRNNGGKGFTDVTASTGLGHLQKGHGIACGDWDRDGDVDVFEVLGGAVKGDGFRNALFQNPGGKGRSITVKLIGKQSNRAAIGARIKVVTSATPAQTIYRHVSCGSSFGANPLEQTLGIGSAAGAGTLEVFWPTSNTTQVFRDIPAGTSLELTEFAKTWRRRSDEPIPSGEIPLSSLN